MKYKTISSVAADVDPVEGIIKGTFAHFGSKDSDGDVIHKNAFDRTVKEHGPLGSNRIKHIVNHDTNRPAGALKELTPDATGLHYVSQLLKLKNGKFLPDSEMILAMVDSGYNTEHSIGYNELPGKTQKEQDYNHLMELKLWEGSTLTFYGANANTPITGLKAMTIPDMVNLFETLEKALKSGEWTDEGYKLIQKHHEAIGIALQSVQVPPTTSSQGDHKQQEEKPDYKAFEERLKSQFTLA